MRSHNLKNWTLHGDMEQTDLLAGTFARGLHFLVGLNETVNCAVIADLATALGSDVTTCGLGPIGENGVRASVAGWMGRACGAASGVAIVTQERRADALRQAVAASALARGVATPLPIAVTEVGGSEPLSTVPLRLRELASWLRAGRGVELGLVILDGLHFSGDRARDAALTLSLQAVESVGVAVLVVARELPAALVRESSVVVEVGDGRIDIMPPQGEPWAREFSLDRVILPDADALAARPGKAAPAAPSFLRPAPAAPIVREPPPLPPITSRAAVVLCRGALDPAIAERFRAAGFALPRNPEDALEGLPEHGRREIIIVGIGDRRAEDLKSVANQLRQNALARGVDKLAMIRVGSESELSA